jgi:FkbM family methyltransferase
MASPDITERLLCKWPSCEPAKHHPIFSKFPIYQGAVPSGYFANFLGVMTKLAYWIDPRPEIEEGYHKKYPLLDEAYFEWIDLLQAVVEAEKHFTMIELGAGWGRWTANAVAALRQANTLPYTMVVVEAEPVHFGWMREHLETNGVDLSQCQLIQAAVAANDGSVGFSIGEDPTWGGPNQWYGQSIGGKTQVQAVSLKTLLAPLERVDLVDMDIQGAEYEVIEAATDEINRKVKRIHIETHNREVERGLRTTFHRLGWKNVFDYPCSTDYPETLESKTEFGVAHFLGGRQSWINPKFVNASTLAELTDKPIPTSLGFELRADPADYVSRLILKDGVYETVETDLISRLVRPEDVCIDGGCHIGYYSCLMGMLVGPTGQVYAFDANPLQVQRTRRNAEINRLHNVEAIHAALGEQSGGTALFNLATDDQTGLSSLGNIPNYQRTIKVPWLRLDDFLKERHVGHVRLLKLDVEGAEEIVLNGLGKLLANHAIDFILLECNDERLRLLDTSTERVAQMLQTHGYTGLIFDENSSAAWAETSMSKKQVNADELFSALPWTEPPALKSREDVNHLFSSPSVRRQVPSVSLAGTLVKAQRELQSVRKSGIAVEQKAAKETSIATPAEAFWRQREMLSASSGRIKALSAAIGRPSDFTLFQWAQIAAFAEEFRPDFILELGRGTGNSTACFTEIAHHLGGAEKCRVLSLCLSDSWRKQSAPKIRRIVPPDWFAPLETLECDILRFDIASRLQNAHKPLVFWDAHGFELAEWVLGELLPKIAFKPHIVMMHDLADIRYCSPKRAYGEEGLWKGISAGDDSMWLGHVYSRVAQAISIIDFTTRNKLPLHSADESFVREIGSDPEKVSLLKNTLGHDLFQLNSHWFWFTLTETEGELTFPKFVLPSETTVLGNIEAAAARNELSAIQNSAGWRMLNRLYRVRDKMAPEGSIRRKLYRFILAPLRSKSTKGNANA